jgi:predicted ATPase
LQDTLPYLFGLLGIVEGADPLAQMDPQIKQQRTLDAIKRIVVRESLQQPLIVIFEDLHWIDEQTQALLDLLVDSIANEWALLLVNYRPEYRHEWGNKSHYVQIGLKPLGRKSAEELLTALLQDAVELQPFKRLIIEKTGGNPFFIEEMVQAVFDEGALVRNGSVKVTRSLSQLRLPSTVQGILAARIDRLSAEQKDLLQMLAVIGRESPYAVINEMKPSRKITRWPRRTSVSAAELPSALI